MAATTQVEKAEEYDTALAGFLATTNYISTADAAMAARHAEWIEKLIALTPSMSQGGEEKVMYEIEYLYRIKQDAIRATAVAKIHQFEDRRRWA